MAVAKIPVNKLNFPTAERAPAANNKGIAGMGTPNCSTSTAANTSGSPCRMRNWLVSVINHLSEERARSAPIFTRNTAEHVAVQAAVKQGSFDHAQRDFPAHSALARTSERLRRFCQREGLFDKDTKFARVNHPGNLRELRAVGANNHEGVTHAWVVAFATGGRNSDQPAVWLQDFPGAVKCFTANRIENDVHIANHVFEPGL